MKSSSSGSLEAILIWAANDERAGVAMVKLREVLAKEKIEEEKVGRNRGDIH